MPQPAARVTDMHACPMCNGPVPHVGGPTASPGGPTVLISMMPAATIGSASICVGPPDTILAGSPTVFVCNKPLARMGDSCSHGGTVVIGAPTVMIG